jgi:hypothetical protein
MKRVNNFNDDYFEVIDSEEKAYFLGLLFADGNVYTARNRVQITLVNEDAYILQKFADCIGYTGKLYIDREKYSKLILPSKKMCADLTSLGCTPNKSLTLKFPTQVPNNLMNHFIRGCFDGDGHVSRRNNCFNTNFTSSNDFMKEFIKLLDNINVEYTTPLKRYIDREESAYQVYIRSSSHINFFNYLYKDSTLYLNRKKDIIDLPIIVKEKKLCSKCSNKHFAKGFCKSHYRNNYFKLYGT